MNDSLKKILFDPNKINSLYNDKFKGWTSLMLMVMSPSIRNITEIIRDHIEKNSLELDKQNEQGETALMLACMHDVRTNKISTDIVELLIKFGANLNLQSKKGFNALMFACRKNFAAVKLLVDADADINLQDGSGNSALMIACRYGIKSVVKILLSNKKTNINLQNGVGRSALMIAYNSDSVDDNKKKKNN